MIFAFQIEYAAFEKNFYTEHGEITKLSEQEVQNLRKTLGIKVRYCTWDWNVNRVLHINIIIVY